MNRPRKYRLPAGKNSLGYYLKNVVLMAAVYAVLLLSATSAYADATVNKYCPVTTSELAEEQFFVDYEGRRIYFCCNNCKRDFLADPEQYLANLNVNTGSLADPSGGNDVETHDDVESHNDDEEHDHTTDHGSTTSFTTIAGKFHPMFTHFPIALIISAFLFSMATIWLKIDTFETVSVYLIYLAAGLGVVTVLLGLAAGSGASYPSFLESYLSQHRILGLVTGTMTLITAYLGYRRRRTRLPSTAYAYRIALLINTILVGLTGHYGSILVFGPDHFNF